MLPPERPDRIQIAFDDHRLVANAGLLLARSRLAQRLGLSQFVDSHVDLGAAPRAERTQETRLLTLVASALAGGDCIDDADVLRTGRTARRSSAAWSRRRPPWGPSCAASVGAMYVSWTGWAASCWPRPGLLVAGPGDGPLTIDLDSTICETYGLAKEGGTAPQLHRCSGAITRSSLSPLVPAMCWCHDCARVEPTPPAARLTFCVRR